MHSGTMAGRTCTAPPQQNAAAPSKQDEASNGNAAVTGNCARSAARIGRLAWPSCPWLLTVLFMPLATCCHVVVWLEGTQVAGQGIPYATNVRR